MSYIDEFETEVLAFEQALDRLRRTRCRICVLVGTFAPSRIQNPAHPETKLGTVGSASIHMTRKQALKWLQDAFPEHWQKKLCLRLRTHRAHRLLFVGEAP